MHCIAVLGEAMKGRDWAASGSPAAAPTATRSGRKLHSTPSAKPWMDDQIQGGDWPPAYALQGHGRRTLGECPSQLPFSDKQLEWIKKINPTCNVTVKSPNLCSLGTVPATGASPAFRQLLKDRTQATAFCLNIECCMEFEPLSLCLGAGLCAPSMSFGYSGDQRQMCVLDINGHPIACASGKGILGGDAQGINQHVSDSYLSADVKLCLLESMAKLIPGGPEVCIHLLQLKYLYLKVGHRLRSMFTPGIAVAALLAQLLLLSKALNAGRAPYPQPTFFGLTKPIAAFNYA